MFRKLIYKVLGLLYNNVGARKQGMLDGDTETLPYSWPLKSKSPPISNWPVCEGKFCFFSYCLTNGRNLDVDWKLFS